MVWFETILVVLTLLTGIVWLVDKLFFEKRRAAAGDLLAEEPVLVDYSRAFFPVLAVVLVLRSFVAEPYKIPSASMMPSLLIGDFILVNKFAYGLRLPINNHKFVDLGEPARGEVVVFKPAHDPHNNWIKRVIGLPGDTVTFEGNALTINGVAVEYRELGGYSGRGVPPGSDRLTLLQEYLPGREHPILEDLDRPVGQGTWQVPAGHYFVMGDNRDNSEDGRLWPVTNFLPEEELRGKAFLVWLNCEGWFCKGGFDPSRIGTRIR